MAIYPKRAFDAVDYSFDSAVLNAYSEAAEAQKPFIVDAAVSCAPSLNLEQATILRRGLSRSGHKSFEIEKPQMIGQDMLDRMVACKIRQKPPKPVLGFCGRAVVTGRLMNQLDKLPLSVVAATMSPALTEGYWWKAQKLMSFSLRKKLLEPHRYKKVQPLFETTTEDFWQASHAQKEKMRTNYAHFMANCDYSLCIRGINNSSVRYYETLAAGRIPVIIDTDVVLPMQEHFYVHLISLKDCHRVDEIIAEDFEKLSDEEYKRIQLHNRQQFEALLLPHTFFKKLLLGITESQGP